MGRFSGFSGWHGGCDPQVMSETPTTSGKDASRKRLRLMLSYGGWEQENFAEQLPRLLQPLGIDCLRVGTANEATDLLSQHLVHIAVVDLRIPFDQGRGEPAGQRVLQLLRRLEQPPPTVVVRARQATQRASARGLSTALREGAFTVMDGPVKLEPMLEVLHRVVRRHYANHWTAA